VDNCWALRAVEHDHLEQVARPVRPDEQEPERVLAHFVNDGGVTKGMIDVGVFDPMPSSRGQYVHT
jgi:hypothetical protein